MFGKILECVRNRSKIEFYEKHEYDKFMKQQLKITFSGIHKSYENCDSYAFKPKKILMDKPIYVGFAVLEMSKLHIY